MNYFYNFIILAYIYPIKLLNQIIRMGILCFWRKQKCLIVDHGEIVGQQEQNRPLNRRQRQIYKPVILFYHFEGHFQCEIKTNCPEKFICFPKTVRKNCIKWQGSIKNNKICIGKHSYPYLFWESYDFSKPHLKPHFRFNGNDIADEIFELLIKLGLNEEQSTNFVTFWIHKWQSQQSWLVHVLSQSTINELYPLCISPKPSQIKRFYLLFGKDNNDVTLERLQIKPWRMSDKSTVIEWGAAEYNFSCSK